MAHPGGHMFYIGLYWEKHFKLEHIRWRAIANPHALEDI